MAGGDHNPGGGNAEARGSGGAAGNDPPAEPLGWQPAQGPIQGDIRPTHNQNDLDYSPNTANNDRWSLPGGPPKWNPGGAPPQPSSTMADDASWTRCRPELIQKLKVFKGDSVETASDSL
ncbi:hypothetical protein EV421DRAFT_1908577 [Armillaria borealis]|uniref:Uncharacterized protein n=1 Tax=Armillaria borealis TaxID=47425 RepID=A0AA39J3M1_9AGAR|nr:hypothetical protein EV421DRAFT_1908577 [Armillaria borealis]